MRKIYFVRHGESKHNAASIYAGTIDSPLTALGKSQAIQTGELLKNKNISHLITSQLKRAQDTACAISDILSTKQKITLQNTPLLNEVNFGDIQNKKIQQIDGLIYGVESGTGESLTSLYTRAKQVIKIIQSIKTKDCILVVGHGAFTAVIFAVYEGISPEHFLDYKKKWRFQNGEIKKILSF
ncbi:MAG: histidine phosphatase family protein [Flavobacteriaceae bacterium]|nr:histidine phosphatase family protein [Flavobacteriaceae bacterium]